MVCIMEEKDIKPWWNKRVHGWVWEWWCYGLAIYHTMFNGLYYGVTSSCWFANVLMKWAPSESPMSHLSTQLLIQQPSTEVCCSWSELKWEIMVGFHIMGLVWLLLVLPRPHRNICGILADSYNSCNQVCVELWDYAIQVWPFLYGEWWDICFAFPVWNGGGSSWEYCWGFSEEWFVFMNWNCNFQLIYSKKSDWI